MSIEQCCQLVNGYEMDVKYLTLKTITFDRKYFDVRYEVYIAVWCCHVQMDLEVFTTT